MFLKALCGSSVIEEFVNKQVLRVMKITGVLLLSVCLTASAKGFTQITLSQKNVSLQTVFKEIQKQTGYDFFYSYDMIQKAGKVTVNIKNGTIEQALDECLKGTNLTYLIVGKTVAIKVKQEIPNADATNVDVQPLIDISGKVTDADGNPLAGATVKVKGSNKLTTTNNDGVFVLKGVDNDATLEISYVGYQPYTVSVNNKSTITASLKLNVITNPEVIINKGYYTEKQKTSVSNVGVVTAKDIEKQPVQNPLLTLQGRTPGLFITQASGNAGGSLKVRIQGENSLQNGSDPLYVVDGIPVDAKLPTTGLDGALGTGGAGSIQNWGNPLNYLNPLDIESIEVLKDADATAIYGSRAANGAILITTKKGKAGSMKLDVNMETGWGKMTHRVDMMNTRQYLDMRYEAFANDHIDWRSPSVYAPDLKVWDTTHYTNWQDELLGGTSRYNNINASVSGGNANVRYLVSGTWHKETTIWPLPKDFADQKTSVHFNLNANNNNQKLRMQLTGNYLVDDNQLPAMDMTQNALTLEPDAPLLLNADGSINWAPDAAGNSTMDDQANPMIQRYGKYVNKTYNLLSSLKLDYTILPGLNIGSSIGYNHMQTNDFTPSPLIAVAPELRAMTKRAANFGNRDIQLWIIEPQANYHTKISRGALDLLAGGTFQDKSALASSINGTGQVSDELLENINAAATVQNGQASTVSHYRYNAVFGRINYNWQDKYILSVNGRRDGSTRFGGDNRFHNFGSVGTGWIFSNESFFKSRFGFLSFGKLRGSYGTTGNDQIGDYQFMSLYNFTTVSVPYQGIVGLAPASLPNPALQWEETKKLQLGIDLGFWQDKLVVNANYVQNRSSNQLLPYLLASQTGYSSYTANFPAVIQNRNWEFMITAKPIQNKNLVWTASANLTIPQNKLLSLGGKLDSTAAWKVGGPIDAAPKSHYLGVAEGTGDYLYATADGHATTSPGANDRNTWISRFPKLYGGLQNSISYRGIQLDFLFQFVKQMGYNAVAFSNGTFGAGGFPGMFGRGHSNQPLTLLDRWQQPGDHASVARFSTYENPRDNLLGSDFYYADGYYISLKNVSLSYDLSQKWMNKAHFKNFRVYLHAQNLLTISNYKGLNPETGNMNSLPPLQVWTVGVQIGL